jgi:hypothetical protein
MFVYVFNMILKTHIAEFKCLSEDQAIVAYNALSHNKCKTKGLIFFLFFTFLHCFQIHLRTYVWH